MPKVSERERIHALEQKLKQLKTLQQRREAKARSVALHRSRRDELRRKILVGAGHQTFVRNHGRCGDSSERENSVLNSQERNVSY
jgi:hypothetical protein